MFIHDFVLIDASPVEEKRRECLPNMSEVTFLELTANNNNADGEYDGECTGTLAPEIYERINEASHQINEENIGTKAEL